MFSVFTANFLMPLNGKRDTISDPWTDFEGNTLTYFKWDESVPEPEYFDVQMAIYHGNSGIVALDQNFANSKIQHGYICEI